MNLLTKSASLHRLVWGGSLFVVLFLGRFAAQNPAIGRVSYLILVGAGLVLLWTVWRTRPWRLATPLDVGLFTAVIVLCVTSYFSLDPFRSWRLTWNWTAAIITFYTAVGLLRLGSRPTWLAQAITGVSLLFALFAYIELANWLMSWISAFGLSLWPTPTPRLSGGSGSPNLLAAILNVGLLLAWSLRSVSGSQRRWWTALFFVLLPPFVLTGSRSAYVALLAGLAVWVIGQAWVAHRGRIPRRMWGRLVLGGLTAVGVTLLLIFLLRGETVQADLFDSVLYRSEFWRIIPIMLGENLLLGTGPDTFGTFYVWHESSVPPGFPFRAAHSLWFSWLGEAGFLGFGVVLLNAMVLIRFLWQARPSQYWKPLTIGFTAASTTFAVHATFDTPDTWMMILGAILLAGWIHLLLEEGVPFTPSLWRTKVSTLWLVVWLVLVASAPVFAQAVQTYQRGLATAEAGDWPTAVSLWQEAQAMLPFTYPPALHAEAYGRGYLAQSDPAQLPKAITSYEKLLAVAPGWSTHYANLAALQYEAGALDAAQKMMHKAILRAPRVYIYPLNLALWQEEQGQIEAETTLRALYGLRDTWHEAPFWQATTMRQTVADENRPVAWSVPAETRAGWEALHRGDVATAVVEFTAVAHNPSAQHGLAVVALLRDDPSAAQAHTQRAALLNNRSLPLLPDLVINNDERLATVTKHTTMGQGRADAYWRSVYQSAGLPMDLLPQLRCFAVSGRVAQTWNFWQTSTWAEELGRWQLPSSETVPCTRP